MQDWEFFALLISSIWSLVFLKKIRRKLGENAARLDDLERTLTREIKTLKAGIPVVAKEPAPQTVEVKPPEIVQQASLKSVAPVSTPPKPKPVVAAYIPKPVPGFVEAPEPVAPPRQPSQFETAAKEILLSIWNWIIVGEEHRPAGVSMEYAVATNWLVRIGIVAVVFGMGFLLKYSIDNEWLGPLARVGLSLLAGVAMMVAGIRLFGRKYQLIGQGLVGGGLATLYFSVYAATNLYHLITDPVLAFGLMAFITLSAGLIAVRLDSILVAVLGIVGGYATPVFLSTGTKNFVGLFAYMLVLGIGILGIAHKKKWHLLNYLGMICNYGLVFATFDKYYADTDFWDVMPFLAAFFVLFSTATIIYNLLSREKSTLLELIGLLINATAFFAFSSSMVNDLFGQKWVGVVSICLAVFYALHVYGFLTKGLADRGLLLSLTGLSTFFLTITLPLMLSKEWITASWALQAVVMLWMAGKLDSRFLQHLAYLIYALVIVRFAFMDLVRQFSTPIPADIGWFDYFRNILVERLVMFGVPLASMTTAWRIMKKPSVPARVTVNPESDIRGWFGQSSMTVVFAVLAVLMLFAYLNAELYRSFGFFYASMRLPVLTALWLALGCFLLFIYQAVRHFVLLILLSIVGVAVLVKLFAFDLILWHPEYSCMRYGGSFYSGMDALMRLFDMGLIVLFFSWMFFKLKGEEDSRTLSKTAGWISMAMLFVYLTMETNTALGFFLPGLRAGGVTILWSIFALSFVVVGIKKGVKSLRLVGLALFSVVIWKVFFSDLKRLGQLYRIAAFIVLGGVMLAGSFVYLKHRQKFISKPEEDK